MFEASFSLDSQLGRKAIRFAVAAFGLLLLKMLVDALPMLQSISPVGDTLLSPLVVANAVVDTLILAAIVSFGLAASREFGRLWPGVPDVRHVMLLLTALTVLVLAYNEYELPLACTLISPEDLVRQDGSAAADLSPVGGAMGIALQQLASGMAAQLFGLSKSSPESVLLADQKLAVARMRHPRDLYGWIFLVLAMPPVIGLVVIGSRNLDAISQQALRLAGTVASGLRSILVVPDRGRANKTLSPEDMDKLMRLKASLDQGTITQADFYTQKKIILPEPLPHREPIEFQRLNQLLDAGILTQEEFETQKQRFLAAM
jgi:hypothetical protein